MAEKEIKQDKSFILWILPQIIYMVFSAGICYLVFFINDKSIGFLIQSLVITLMFGALAGIAVRRFFPISVSVDADNEKRLFEFWTAYGLGMLLSASCIFMPDSVWPFTGIFVILSVFGGNIVGITCGISLLVMSVLLTGTNQGVLIIYLMCGILAVIIITAGNKKTYIQLKFFSVLLILFGMITFGIAISAPDSISVYSFIYPLINVLLSGILMFVGIRFFINENVAPTADKYLVLNDTSYPILVEEKEKNYDNYMTAVHTSYFCERIASKLGLDRDAMKCAGFYYRFCPTGLENRALFLEENEFPKKASLILKEYTDFISKRSKGKVFSRECVVLVCAQTIVVTSLAMHTKNNDIKIAEHIDKIVDATFERYFEADTFSNSDITFRELQTVKELFKGEKLYYDFLCGK